ncbi:serine/threonine-protein kinase [Microbacterium dauci]|uniref:Serine/threonine-protein kinase n=1 Tax=Microbacterium dauci TaxID=3048008 RepID=A0ABT6ZDI1_9MICO|nr:serine/threonine-protein kinase [Microbacterium sp. LX3-4]MDJ1114219.1 serine/threonine-protein kinase [Microbacterium sp. LX3-4]
MPTDHERPAEPLLDGRYRLGDLVGEGGMARVYRAEDTSLGRTVALKLIRPGLEGMAVPERARSETTVLASLNHPSLVTLFDARLVPGQPEYLVMEFVDGPTLADRIAAGPLPSREVTELAAELGEALHVVHASGVVHRDLKPSNVLFAQSHVPGGRARAKLADFGIALLLDTARVTSPGTVIGTAAYLAPEQVRGAEPAAAADIYALGLVLLEALTGRRAYPQSDSLGSALARLSTPPDIPASLGPGWVDLLGRMTAAEPSARPTALEVVRAAEALNGRVDAAGSIPGATGAAAAGAAETPTVAVGVPDDDAPTRRYTEAVPPAPAPAGQGGARVAKRRLPVAAVAAFAAVAVVVAVVVWTIGASMVSSPATPSTPPTVVSPAATPAAPSPEVTPELTEAERKAAEKAAKDAKKAAEEAEKAAKEAEKQANRDKRGPKDDD